MPIKFHERNSSRGFTIDTNSRSLTRNFFLSGTTNQDDAEAAIIVNTPVTIGILSRKSVKADPAGGDCWFVDVEYGTIDANTAIGATPGEPTSPGSGPGAGEFKLDNSFSIETTANTVHITKALETLRRQTTTGNDGPDEKLTIGATTDRIEGCDIFAGSFTFSRTVPRASVDMNYINTALFVLVGKTNANPFYGFARGELLYLGCTGNFSQQERWSLTHKFAAQPNEVNVNVGGGIVLPNKGGWEYVWVRYKPDNVGNLVLPVPEVAYLQRVYAEGDFSLLGIGV